MNTPTHSFNNVSFISIGSCSWFSVKQACKLKTMSAHKVKIIFTWCWPASCMRTSYYGITEHSTVPYATTHSWVYFACCCWKGKWVDWNCKMLTWMRVWGGQCYFLSEKLCSCWPSLSGHFVTKDTAKRKKRRYRPHGASMEVSYTHTREHTKLSLWGRCISKLLPFTFLCTVSPQPSPA